MSSTRETILGAAWGLLDDAGARALSMEEVAKAAGVSRQAVYLHFKSKADLVLAVVEHAKARLGFDRSTERVRTAKSGEEALVALFDMHAELAPKIARASRAIEAERSRDASIDAAWQKHESARLALTRAVIDRIAAEGRLAKGWTAATAVDLVWAVTAAGVTDDLVVRRRWSREKLGDNLFHLIAGSMLEKGKR